MTGPPRLALDQLQEAWRGSVLPAVEERGLGGRPAAAMLANAHPVSLEEDVLTLEFAKADTFQRAQAEDPKNVAHLVEALYGVTGHRLAIRFTSGEGREDVRSEAEHPTTEEGFIELMKTTFDAQELDV